MRPNAVVLAAVAVLTAPALAAEETADMGPLLEAGIPAVDRAWAGVDYEAVARVLAAGKVPLPTLETAPGRRFLERFASTENLSMLRAREFALGPRLQSGLASMQGSAQVLMLYAARGPAVHEELARLLAFQLRLVDAMLELVDELLPTIPKDDQYATRMEGLQKLRGGLAQVYMGSAISLSETKVYAPGDLSRILAAMAETLPRARAYLSADARTELRVKLQAVRPSFEGEDAKRIDGMLAEMGK
jgi:hypothetical protein